MMAVAVAFFAFSHTANASRTTQIQTIIPKDLKHSRSSLLKTRLLFPLRIFNSRHGEQHVAQRNVHQRSGICESITGVF